MEGGNTIKRNKESIITDVTNYYLESSDFNGYPMQKLIDSYDSTQKEIKEIIAELIKDGKIEIVCSNMSINPHIKHLPSPSIAKQIEAFTDSRGFPSGCLYPSPTVLEKQMGKGEFSGGSYTRQLALGAAQLEYRVFDLSILEYYRNDPRYIYDVNGISGSVSVRDEYFETGALQEHDEVLLQTFGFAFDQERNVAVAVYLRYLHDLSEEHQNIWAAKELNGNYKLHPDYYRSTILGDWGEKISIFDAFLSEMRIINKMSETMGRPLFFRDTYEEKPPKDFCYLLRPTVKEYNAFIMLLDNMLSSNIEKKFFKDDIPKESEEKRADGKIVVRNRGTLQLLENWLKQTVILQEPEMLNEIISALKRVRSLRQRPAHRVEEDAFNQDYLKMQRDLIVSTYTALRNLRLIFACHPMVRANPPKISKLLFEGRIWNL
jgi:hypothetical protein